MVVQPNDLPMSEKRELELLRRILVQARKVIKTAHVHSETLLYYELGGMKYYIEEYDKSCPECSSYDQEHDNRCKFHPDYDPSPKE